jgi:hypothetical protein
MKKIILIFAIAAMVFLGKSGFAQEKNYKDGSVWQVGLIKSSANMSRDYLNSLKNSWVAVHEEGVKQGLIVSYKILSGSSSNPDDWDIMLLTEFKSMAAMEAAQDKWDPIEKKVLGSEDAMKKLNESRISIRTVYGGKLLREVLYK